MRFFSSRTKPRFANAQWQIHPVGRVFKVNPQSVANWVSAYTAQLPKAPLPEKVKKAELDELFTFVGKKKNEIYLLTIVDRDTRRILSWDFVLGRTPEALQACLERANTSQTLLFGCLSGLRYSNYRTPYEMRTDKQETYSVEAVNADLRHYLKRLARKSRCFTRRL